MSSRYQKEISSAVKGISQPKESKHIKICSQIQTLSICVGFLTDEVSRVLPSLVIQDQDDSPRPKIAAHVTGSYIPETEKSGGQSRFKKDIMKPNLSLLIWDLLAFTIMQFLFLNLTNKS